MGTDLKQYENADSAITFAEAIGTIYKGKMIEMYWGESGGNLYYSDYDVSQNMYVEGRVLWGKGTVIALEVDHITAEHSYKKQILCNAWGITFVSEKGDLKVTNIFKGKI